MVQNQRKQFEIFRKVSLPAAADLTEGEKIESNIGYRKIACNLTSQAVFYGITARSHTALGFVLPLFLLRVLKN